MPTGEDDVGKTMRKTLPKPKVLFFQKSFSRPNRTSSDGVFRYARDAGWNVQTICFSEASASLFSRNLSVDSVRKLIEFWHPQGCIVDCGGRTPDMVFSAISSIPVVFLDCDPSEVEGRAVCVTNDSRAVATFAAKELLSLGFMDYAYLTHSYDVVWSRIRGEEFRRLVQMNGRRFHACPAKLPKNDAVKMIEVLSRWVSTLPRPCGVFAANDNYADMVVRACVSEGISVPEEIAVIGVDDDKRICENAMVSLSSIRLDNEHAGYLAAELLAECLATRDCGSVKSGTFGVVGVSRRASTRLLHIKDTRVRSALEFIRRYGCERITVSDVVREMGCSRRFADLRFGEVIGHTILNEIRSVRIERVKELLGTPNQDIAAIPDVCGYVSLPALCRDFKKCTGMTMREWRRKNSPMGHRI